MDDARLAANRQRIAANKAKFEAIKAERNNFKAEVRQFRPCASWHACISCVGMRVSLPALLCWALKLVIRCAPGAAQARRAARELDKMRSEVARVEELKEQLKSLQENMYV